MHLPKWFLRSLLWCKQAFGELIAWKKRGCFALFRFIDRVFGTKLLRVYITPNRLCYSRGLVGVLNVFLYLDGRYGALPMTLFGLAVLTDLFDGPLAEYTRTVSERGKLLDANADKVLVLVPLLLIGFFRFNRQLVTWLIVVEVCLYFTANSLKPLLRRRYGIPLVTGSNAFGQIKMSIESVAIGIVLYDPMSMIVVKWGQWLIFLGIVFGILSFLRHLYRMEHGVHLDPRKRLITIPNLVTLAGLFLFIPAGFAIAYQEWVEGAVYIGLIFLSDVIDGLIARRFHQVTYSGTALDPFRDFLARGLLAGWMIVVSPFVIKAFLTVILIIEIISAVMNVHISIKVRQLAGVTVLGQRRAFVHYLGLSALYLHLSGLYVLPLWAVILTLFCMLVFSMLSLVSYVSHRRRLLEDKR